VIEATIHQGVHDNTPVPEVRHPELVRCSRHEGENCPRCDASGYRQRRYCAGCGEPAGRPSRGGKALMGLRNRRGWDQPFYCLGCHPELGRGGLAVLEGKCD
jgi:predicted amidophosphoribosyltransferase